MENENLNSLYIEGQMWESEKRGISNGQTIPKLPNFWNFDGFPNWKNSENLLIFQVVKLWKFVNFPTWKIPKISHLENS